MLHHAIVRIPIQCFRHHLKAFLRRDLDSQLILPIEKVYEALENLANGVDSRSSKLALHSHIEESTRVREYAK